jgi:hypothetical protein
LPCCVNHLYKAHSVVNDKLLSIRVFYRRIIGLARKEERGCEESPDQERKQAYLCIIVAWSDEKAPKLEANKPMMHSPTKQFRVNWGNVRQ